MLASTVDPELRDAVRRFVKTVFNSYREDSFNTYREDSLDDLFSGSNADVLQNVGLSRENLGRIF